MRRPDTFLNYKVNVVEGSIQLSDYERRIVSSKISGTTGAALATLTGCAVISRHDKTTLSAPTNERINSVKSVLARLGLQEDSAQLFFKVLTFDF